MSIVLHPNEQIIRTYHRYVLTYFWHWLLVFIFVTAPFFFMFVLFSWGQWGIGIFFASLILAFFILLRAIFYWRKNKLVVTTERIIKVERKSLLNKIVTDLNFYNIRSISYKIKGVWPTIFRYGKITIENNDIKSAVQFNSIRRPAEAVSLMAQIQQKHMQNGLKPLNLEAVLNIIKNETKDNLLKLKEGIDKRLKELV